MKRSHGNGTPPEAESYVQEIIYMCARTQHITHLSRGYDVVRIVCRRTTSPVCINTRRSARVTIRLVNSQKNNWHFYRFDNVCSTRLAELIRLSIIITSTKVFDFVDPSKIYFLFHCLVILSSVSNFIIVKCEKNITQVYKSRRHYWAKIK